jgi:hypothetical protein
LSFVRQFAKFVENPGNAQKIIISCIMVGRPTIMLTDNAVPMQTRRYAATREFFTELFGLSTTTVLLPFLEYFLPKWTDKTHTLTGRKAFEFLKKADWKGLSPAQQAVKSRIVIGSWAAVVLAAALITPILNNKVINKKVLGVINGILDKVLGKPATITPTVEQPDLSFLKSALSASPANLAPVRQEPVSFPNAYPLYPQPQAAYPSMGRMMAPSPYMMQPFGL